MSARSPRRYDVRILYREPTYHATRNGDQTGGPVYRRTFHVVADDEAGARTEALSRFDAEVRAETVGWAREVVEVVVGIEGA